MADTESRPAPHRSPPHPPWRRPGIAIAAAAPVFGLTAAGILPTTYALPLIGLLLACGAGPDTTPVARPLARSRPNAAIGTLVLVAFAAVALEPQLRLPLIVAFGADLSRLVLTLLAVAVLGLPLTMAESSTPIDDLPPGRVVATRRNLMLALTVMVSVATWHATVGLSALVLAVLVLLLPVVLAVSRLRQARRGRVHPEWWRHPLRAGHRWHLLQVLNVALLCTLVGILMLPGTFDALRLFMPAAGYQAFQAWFLAGLAGFVLLAVIPLRHVHLGSNLLVVAGSAFVAVQLVMIYQPAVEPVTVTSPLSGEWYVSHGGHAELVNYHHVTLAQRDALDILQVVDGRSHCAGSTDLRSYHIFEEPLLAPADGIVTSVVDGLPDQPIGSADNEHAAGNQVVIDVGSGRYVMLGHIRRGSTRVAVGDQVRAGQVIAQVGNSGNTQEPHVHIQAQNLPLLDDDTDDFVGLLRTLRTYPLAFREVVLTRDGSVSTPAIADPRRGDLLKPAFPGSEDRPLRGSRC